MISSDPEDVLAAFAIARVGADHVLWASDFPHPDAAFPDAVDEFLELDPGPRRRRRVAPCCGTRRCASTGSTTASPAAERAAMSGLLDGMKVLDPSWWRPMPHATQILADLGAQVLKIEPPGGDPMRAYPDIFAGLARHKRSITLDLKSDDGRTRALELAAEADVFCEAWRPGVAERLGLGYDTLRTINPAIIYCSISGYGQTGPWRDLAGHDLNYQALGARSRPGRTTPPSPRSRACRPPISRRARFAALLVSAAWGKRHLTGEGERIDVAMADAIAWWIGPKSNVRVEGAERSHGGHPAYGVFRTADGRYLTLAPLGEQHLFDGICKALGLDDFVGLPFLERLALTEQVNGRVRAAIAELDADDAFDQLRSAGAPVSLALTPEEMAVHPQIQAHGRRRRRGRHRGDRPAGDAQRQPGTSQRAVATRRRAPRGLRHRLSRVVTAARTDTRRRGRS